MNSLDDQQRLDFLLEARAVLDGQIDDLRRKLGLRGRRRSRNVMPECGTESAYQRHRYYKQPVDDACKKAHAAHNRRGLSG